MQRVRARRFTFHLSPVCNCAVLCWFGFVLGVCLAMFFVFGSLHLGFLHGFRLGPIGLLLAYHRRLYDRQSLERARHELKKRVQFLLL